MEYSRIFTRKSKLVPVSADAFWQVLIDWGALMDWIPKLDEDPPAPVSGCELLPGQSADNLPCTRRVYLESGSTSPSYLDEILLHVDDEARRLYYTFDGIGPGGVRNYNATTFVDAHNENSCVVTCASQYDIARNGPGDMQEFIENFYEKAIIDGIAKMLTNRR